MNSRQDEPDITPVLDTWGNSSHAASWMWSPRSRPASHEVVALNAWGADELTLTLETLQPFARVRSAYFDGGPGVPLVNPSRDWNSLMTSQAGFVRGLVNTLRNSRQVITSVSLTLDLDVWVRVAAGGAPVRGWVSGMADANLFFDDDPYGAISMGHTLFVDGAWFGQSGDSNTELHRLNAPLLKDALARIEARLGPIVEVDGLDGITRTGFASLP